MRVVSLPLCGIGFMSLAMLGVQLQAQQSRKALPEVRPLEQVSIAPVTFEWSELVQMQASMPRMAADVPGDPSVTLEPPIVELSMSGSRPFPHETPGGIEALSPCTGFASEPPIGAGFDSQLDVPDGMGFSFIPPDVAGGVGPRHLMTMLNNQVLVTDRLGGSPIAVDTSIFWSPLGTTPASPTTVYPRVHYDDLHGRWLATIRNGLTSTGSTQIFVAISQTDDPTGTWDYYSITADPAATTFADWVLLGYNASWITITANMFTTPAGASFAGAKMWTIDATSLPPGGLITISTFPAGFMTTVHGSGGSSPHPARTFDSDPTLYLINNGFTASGVFLLQVTRITGTGAAPVVSGIAGSPFGGSTSLCLVTTNFSATSRTMAQIGDPRFISAFSNRIASVAVRNGKVWVANAAGTPGPSTNAAPTEQSVLWHQLDPTLPFPASPGAPGTMIVQSGAISNGANTMSMYPSLAVNCADDVLIGFSNGDATRSPRACYAFRLGTDAPNFMGPIGELKAGESVYWKNFGVGTTAQYGRYSSTAVDPNDDKTLWTLQEYADQRVATPGVDNDSRWGTWWGRFGDCEELPLITDEPDDQLGLCVGDPVTFSVAASSSSPLTYQWRHDGIDIPGANADSYSIGTTVAGDAGTYDVVVCGCGQTISLTATLSFTGAAITTQPMGLTAAVGTMASFSVVATGMGTLSYQWLFNGNPIPLATADTYTIASVTVGDYGFYSVVVTDDCGPATSDSARLSAPVKTGKTAPAELSLHVFQGPVDTVGCNGGMATFSVLAFPAGVTYEWRHNGTPIVPAETGASLTIDPVSPADAGMYDVVVSLGAQSTVSAPATLTVEDVPVITVQPSPSNVTLLPGDSITYSITATGATTYQWRFKSNVPFSSFVDLPGETGPSLTLENLAPANSGRYRCVARNACGGTASNQVTLTIF